MTNLLDKQWDHFEQEMIAPTVSANQRDILRLAYWAGALGYQTAMLTDDELAPGDIIDVLNAELIEFARNACIKRGCGCCEGGRHKQ